ncbi:NADPH-dependent glutamate synthase [Hungatella hominis]|uniref:NADPH-dependent glutamate synthase n=1 Tax=Hungatella hominis TaxID=2763050 RepID=A0ABR7GZP5_9FIRM|nr:NADPH-dependent glutamate synthase [Hungatella hominis]MBC5706350.1 NADPH-dependent glutamate synthase [Hungatella hominis]
MDMMKKVPVREQDPKVRATNFEEVCLGYNEEEARAEASRCLKCKNPKCVGGCPVSIDIPGFIKEVQEGNYEEAAKVIAKSSALPAVCGRVCPQESQCEGQCIRGIKGEPISIGKLERFVADWSRENGFVPAAPEKTNGRKVAVIGSGPSGVTCAGDLAKMGYEVTIFEALHEPGGVLTYGIPEFRLPKEGVVQPEIDNVRKLGVKIETDVIIGKSVTIDELLDEEGFEAVFIGSGAGLPMFMGIPGENANGVFSANEYLTRSNLMKAFRDDYDTPIVAGKKVAVVGGGNVAMDAARTALRLGADVHIVYRRSEAELPARAEEVHHAKEEGIIFNLLTNPIEILTDDNGWVNGMKCIKMELGEPDASGRRRPVAIEGSEFVIEVDTVIMSLGTSPNPLISATTKGLETNRRKCIVAEESNGKTTKEGVYAGGDAVTGAATVILAMEAGRAGARGIHEYLSGQEEA